MNQAVEHMQEHVFINGEYRPLEQATISVTDRGFLFGDGVYEIVPVYHGKLFRLEEHFARLDKSLATIQLTNPYSHSKIIEIFEHLIKLQTSSHQSVYLQITRGAATKRNHAFPKDCKPTVYVRSAPFTPPTLDSLKQGGTAITLADTRWSRCDVKSTSLLANVLLTQEAIVQNAKESILIKDGFAIEGSSSNIFIVKDNMITTPPMSHQILGGITRDFILENLNANNIPYSETNITEEELIHADEIWICSSTREIVPIIQLNDQKVGSGTAGPVWETVISLYKAAIHNLAD